MIKESILSAMSSDVITVNEAASLLDIYERGGITMDSKYRMDIYEYFKNAAVDRPWVKFEDYEKSAFARKTNSDAKYDESTEAAAKKFISSCDAVRKKLISQKKKLIAKAKSNSNAFIDDINLTDNDFVSDLPDDATFNGDCDQTIKLSIYAAETLGTLLLKCSASGCEKLTRKCADYARSCMYDVDDMAYVILEFIRVGEKGLPDPDKNTWRNGKEPEYKFEF